MPIRIFLSFAPEDESLLRQLEAHLSTLVTSSAITIWHQQKIRPGQQSIQEINDHLDAAQIILPLVSPDFFVSERCRHQLQRALKRLEQRETLVVPILLRPCLYEHSPLGQLEVLPGNAKPITSWPDRNEAFVDVARRLNDFLVELESPTSTHPSPVQIPSTADGNAFVPVLMPSQPSSRKQETQNTRSSPPAKEQSVSYFEQGYALIIGVAKYAKISKLSEVIVKDAVKLHDIVRASDKCGYRDNHVKLLYDADATADQIRDHLRWLAQSTKQDCTIILYFSGHGWRVQTDGKVKYYLLPYDGDLNDLDKTAISSEKLSVLNSCHSCAKASLLPG